MSARLRPATVADAAAVRAIYAHHVLHGLGTFEETPPSVEEMATRMTALMVDGLPWLLAEADGRAVAFAYATQFRPRSAYRHTVEDSVYVAPDALGQGHGRAALAALIDTCRGLGKRSMCAVIGDSGNTASIGLHEALGFRRTGIFREIGFKHGRWVDVVFMQRALVDYDAPP